MGTQCLLHGGNGNDAVGEPEPPLASGQDRAELFAGDSERERGVLHGDELFEAGQPQPAAPCAPDAGAQPLEPLHNTLCKELFTISTK